MDDLQQQWQRAKSSLPGTAPIADAALRTRKSRAKQVLHFQYGNIIVLVLTWIGVAAFFNWIRPQTGLAITGMVLMLAGLGYRIGVEVVSALRWRKIQVTGTAAQLARTTFRYYSFRQRVHGPVTLASVVLYAAGFYCLAPLFGAALSRAMNVYIHVSFPIIAIALVWIVRKEVRKELEDLRWISALHRELEGE